MNDEITIIYNIKKLREFPSIPIMYSSKYVSNIIKNKDPNLLNPRYYNSELIKMRKQINQDLNRDSYTVKILVVFSLNITEINIKLYMKIKNITSNKTLLLKI